jgi:hypothetical protein
MGANITREKIVGVILVVIGIYALGYSQTAINVPIVSDEEVVVQDSTVRIVDKDEIQRIMQDMAENQKRLEDRIAILEYKVQQLEEQLQGE